jgi:hypothetical protein
MNHKIESKKGYWLVDEQYEISMSDGKISVVDRGQVVSEYIYDLRDRLMFENK